MEFGVWRCNGYEFRISGNLLLHIPRLEFYEQANLITAIWVGRPGGAVGKARNFNS